MRSVLPKTPRLAVVTFAAAAWCVSAGARFVSQSSRSGGNPAAARRMKIEGISNVAEVTPNLYRGGVPSKEGFQELGQMGINIVVDLRGSHAVERKEVTELGMQYVALPWHCPFPRDAVFARFLSLLRENSGKKVFVHCRLGDDRAGMMIAAYRMAEQGWTPQAAMKEMEAYGFSFSHHFICPGLASYEAHFPKRFRTSPAFQSLREEQKASASRP
jgi:tyrosine-protein phosphatase SIW14